MRERMGSLLLLTDDEIHDELGVPGGERIVGRPLEGAGLRLPSLAARLAKGRASRAPTVR